jgi:hypothetical protein
MATYEKAGPTITAEVVDGYDYNIRFDSRDSGPITATIKITNSSGDADFGVVDVSTSSLTEQQKADLVSILNTLRADALTANGYTQQ